MKILYIIPGFGHSKSNKNYLKISHLFPNTKSIVININWKNKVFSDYINDTRKQFIHKKSDEVYLLGFSFGAIIALMLASKVKPKKLFLCSISPYFSEDIPKMKNSWKSWFGKKRIEDIKKYNFNKITKQIKSNTIILAGDKEGKQLLLRSKEANKKIKNSKLIIIINGKHNLFQEEYLNALRNYPK
ncbi:MAG TPA: hypothetical protein VI815_00650 [Candidatus Nanoarchaeia archaeon]|nr:hypothetical protein [Candidatus Nanoarchaeia archaeon]